MNEFTATETAATMIERLGDAAKASAAAWRTYNRLWAQGCEDLADRWAAVAHAVETLA